MKLSSCILQLLVYSVSWGTVPHMSAMTVRAHWQLRQRSVTFEYWEPLIKSTAIVSAATDNVPFQGVNFPS